MRKLQLYVIDHPVNARQKRAKAKVHSPACQVVGVRRAQAAGWLREVGQARTWQDVLSTGHEPCSHCLPAEYVLAYQIEHYGVGG